MDKEFRTPAIPAPGELAAKLRLLPSRNPLVLPRRGKTTLGLSVNYWTGPAVQGLTLEARGLLVEMYVLAALGQNEVAVDGLSTWCQSDSTLLDRALDELQERGLICLRDGKVWLSREAMSGLTGSRR